MANILTCQKQNSRPWLPSWNTTNCVDFGIVFVRSVHELNNNQKTWGILMRLFEVFFFFFSYLQRLIQNELIFRLLLKVTVDWPRECNLIQFMWKDSLLGVSSNDVQQITIYVILSRFVLKFALRLPKKTKM